MCIVKRGREARDGAKAEISLDWDCVSSLQSPVSANRTGGSVIFGLQLQENEVKKKRNNKPNQQTIERDCKSFGSNVVRLFEIAA